MVLWAYVVAGLAATAVALDIKLPKPSRPEFEVFTDHIALYDNDRLDPYDFNTAQRAVMMTLHLPINATHCNDTCSFDYMPPETAKVANKQFFGNESAGIFESIHGEQCCGSNTTIDLSQYTPVIFEPDVGTSRHLYTAMAREIASQGHPVIVIDHPSDSLVVEFSPTPDTHTIVHQTIKLSPYEPLRPWNTTVTEALTTRIADINFVLHELLTLRHLNDLFPSLTFTHPFSLTPSTPLGIIGHGLGGTVATFLSATDPRFTISINLSGASPPLTSPTTSQILFFGRTGTGTTPFTRDHAPHWLTTWPLLHGKASELDMLNAGPLQFSDLPLVAELAGYGVKPRGVRGLGEDREGVRSWQCVAYLSRVYLTIALRGGVDDALERSMELKSLVQEFAGEMRPYSGGKGRGTLGGGTATATREGVMPTATLGRPRWEEEGE